MIWSSWPKQLVIDMRLRTGPVVLFEVIAYIGYPLVYILVISAKDRASLIWRNNLCSSTQRGRRYWAIEEVLEPQFYHFYCYKELSCKNTGSNIRDSLPWSTYRFPVRRKRLLKNLCRLLHLDLDECSFSHFNVITRSYVISSAGYS